ncbi:MAG: S41 family peptidase, partial [Caldilineaceae bacterium]
AGLILDMRSNGGGWDIQYLTMASYLFNEENPFPFRWVDEALWDAESDSWLRDAKAEWLLSAPRPEAYFGGDVVLLVDASCGSSCEFFSVALASQDRVTVVGAQGTAGAGGPIKVASLPGGLAFQYTWKGGVLADSDELALEAKGVELDVRVPVTLEFEQARIDGADPVLAAGIETLQQLAAERLLATTTLISVTETSGLFTTVAPEGWAQQGNNFLRPNGTDNLGFQVASPPIADLAPVLAGQGITDLESAFVEEREANGLTWTIYQHPFLSAGVELNRQYAIASDETSTYVLVTTSLGFLADAMREAVLHPAIDACALTAAGQ